MAQNLEILAIILALLYVFGAARGQIYCWPAGLLSSLIYAFLCFQANLFPETILQFFYVGFSVYGWIRWKKPAAAASKDVFQVKYISKKILSLVLITGLFFSALVGWYFDHFTQAALPWLDAHIMVFSLLTTWLVAEKIIENWYFWMVIDLAAAYLYYARGMELTAGLYLFYVAMAIWGLLAWKKTRDYPKA